MKINILLMILTITWIQVASAETIARRNDNNLEQKYAIRRGQMISNVSYDLQLKFSSSDMAADEYSGRVQIQFDLNQWQDLTLDYLGAPIKLMEINGKAVTNYKIKNGFIIIPKNLLTNPKQNQTHSIVIEYKNKFSDSGDGIMRFVDPEDQAEYIATDFEPYQAHTMFPCFDQPDLKAPLTLEIDLPRDWTAVGNDVVVSSENYYQGEQKRKRVKFQATKPLSTYLYFAGAGPFKEWKTEHNGLPVYLWARKSMAKYVDVDRIMETTFKGLDFFSDYFKTPYPFSKYGQIFIPEFSWGGMENPGAITLNEKNIYRGPVTNSKIEGRDNLILHEMAHMWFGDLVTMKWWDDLWLNESFASYVASLAQDKILNQRSAWIEFASDKNWGYWQDQLSTTHPIEGVVVDTRSTRGNFDGITYAKGAASLKQLHYYLGDDGFRQGLQSYFKEFAFKNTTRADFMRHLSKASNANLDLWTKKWLQTAGPNVVEAKFSCLEGKINQFELKQKKSVSGNLLPHRTQLGLYQNKNGMLELVKTIDVSYQKEITQVDGLKGEGCPDFVFPNIGDYDYALNTIDEQSLKHLPLALNGGIQDSLTRLLLWSTMNQMVRHQKMATSKYLELALEALEKEQDSLLLSILLGGHSPIREQFLTYLKPDERISLAPKFEALLLKKLGENKKNQDLYLTYFDFYMSLSQSAESSDYLLEVYTQNKLPNGLELGPERRWSIVRTLARRGDSRAIALLPEAQKLDKSALGERMAYAIQVSVPNIESKRQFWKEFDTPEKIGINKFQEGASEFHNENFPEITRNFLKDYFLRAKKINWSEQDTLVDTYFSDLFPGSLCEKEVLKLSKKALLETKTLTSLAKRGWTEANDELGVCLAVRSYKKQ